MTEKHCSVRSSCTRNSSEGRYLMHAHPEQSTSHEMSSSKLSVEEHVVTVTVNMDGMAKPTTRLSNDLGWRRTRNPIGTKWIDINKGNGHRVEIRSRLLTTELKVHQVNLARQRLRCDSTIGSRTTLEELDDD